MPPKRTSTSETPAITLAAIQQLITDGITAALEAQAATMANADNPNRKHCKCAKEVRVTFATGTLTNDALSWWNAYAQPIGIEQANMIPWTDYKKALGPNNFHGGLPRSPLKENVTTQNTQTLRKHQHSSRLMDQIIKHDSVQETNNHKRKFEDKRNTIDNNNYPKYRNKNNHSNNRNNDNYQNNTLTIHNRNNDTTTSRILKDKKLLGLSCQKIPWKTFLLCTDATCITQELCTVKWRNSDQKLLETKRSSSETTLLRILSYKELDASFCSSSEGIVAIVNKLGNLGRDMKKLKENVHAIQVGCQTCEGAYLDKECPLNEEVNGMEEVKYGEFSQPFPNNRYDGRFKGGYDQPSSGEKRPSLTKIINKYIEEASKRQAKQEEWLKKFYQSTEANRETHDKIIQGLKGKEIEYFSANSGFSDNEEQETDDSGMAEVVAALKATLKKKREEPKKVKQNDIRMPIILGRPLLDTAHTQVDIFRKTISLEVESKKVIFKMRTGFTTTNVESVRSIKSKTFIEYDNLKEIDYSLFLYDSESYFSINIEKHYWESNNDSKREELEWENLSLNDLMRIRYGKVCKMIGERILKDYWRERFGDEEDDLEENLEDLEECGEDKANTILGVIHEKLNNNWFNNTSEDEDDLEGILDYLKPISYDGFIDLDDEAYNKRRCRLLGMTYEEPTLILIEKAKVTRYTVGQGET
ncbi:hypothetical protein Tco_0908178 [Tanacetum coccineum]|uniref:Reverse transcriptase domain-containing protein n=1 Tax=Tanacetum coccineum TaxID=301880 RepID=A0ABQ5CNI1_9ASTR